MNCQNYPYQNFSTYGECDIDFVYKEYVNKYELMPFWVTNNMTEVTKLRQICDRYVLDVCMNIVTILFYLLIYSSHIDMDKFKDSLMGRDLMEGTAVSKCPRPCLTTKVHIYNYYSRMNIFGQIIGARFSSARRPDVTKLDITIEEKVTVTESFYPSFSPLSFFTMMGGAVGLWLGVGLVQMMKYGVSTITFILSPNKS